MDITERTKVNLFAVLVAIPTLIVVTLWLAAIDAKATEAKEQVSGMRALLIDVRERVIRIEVEIKKTRRNK